MKYAIISDIHGNIHAFKAVIADAKNQGADAYLLLGDYTNSFPYGNDVVENIRKLKPVVAVRGNGEEYLMNLQGRSLSKLTDEQFKPVYWSYQTLAPKNFEYLASLPETAVISECNTKIYLAHSMSLFYRTPEIKLFRSHHFSAIMNEKPFTHKEYLFRAREALLSCPEAMSEMMRLPKDIYIFGHNHLQFHMEYDGRLFINPGSCGEPLDCDTRAAYTLLTIEKSGRAVTERRVKYDLESVADGLTASGFSAYAPMWSKIMKLEIFTGKDYFLPFVIHLTKTGHKMGLAEFPVNNDIWMAAVRTWDADKI